MTTPMQKFTKHLPIFFLPFIWLLLGCGSFGRIGSADTPTLAASPTATPATAEARVEAYKESMSHMLWHLERDVSQIGLVGTTKADAFTNGLGASTFVYGMDRMLELNEIPSTEDAASLGLDIDYRAEYLWIRSTTAPCGELASIALNAEGFSLSQLQAAAAPCMTAIEIVERELPEYFQCPEYISDCKD